MVRRWLRRVPSFLWRAPAAIARPVANLLTDLGQLLAETGEPLAAAAMFGDALALHRRDGNPYGEVTALGNVADVKRQLGDFAGARGADARGGTPRQRASAIGAPRAFRS